MNKLVIKKKLQVISDFAHKVMDHKWIPFTVVAVVGFVLGAKIF